MLEAFQSDAVQRTDVAVSGEWQSGPKRDWRGEARAAEPLVAVSFRVCGDSISWCKSERGNPKGQPVRLLLGHYDSQGLDVQVSFSVGGGHVLGRTVLDSPAYRPEVPASIAGATGTILPFSAVHGSRSVELFVLFLVGTDVKVGRNGLWHLRPGLVESVPDRFRKLLTYGRTGELAAA